MIIFTREIGEATVTLTEWGVLLFAGQSFEDRLRSGDKPQEHVGDCRGLNAEKIQKFLIGHLLFRRIDNGREHWFDLLEDRLAHA